MAQQALIIQIFVASPSDVQDEREQLEEIVSEANRSWAKSAGLRLELLKWENIVHPGFGQDAQWVINSQMGDNYDIFVGILWSRFGSETARAGSGTEEEFDRALSRFRSTGRPEVLVYFKDTPLPPSKIDPDQLEKVQNFREKVNGNGGIYGSFKDSEGFQSSLRVHLSTVIQKPAINGINKELSLIPTVNVDFDRVTEDDLGYLDFIEQCASQIPELNAILTEIAEATSRIGTQFSDRTGEMKIAVGPPTDLSQVRKTSKRAADDLSIYAMTLGNKIPILTILSRNVFKLLSNALALHNDFNTSNPNDLISLKQQMAAMTGTLIFTRRNVMSFKEAVVVMPRITKEINKAKRATIGQLSELIAEIDQICNLAANIRTAVEELLKPLDHFNLDA